MIKRLGNHWRNIGIDRKFTYTFISLIVILFVLFIPSFLVFQYSQKRVESNFHEIQLFNNQVLLMSLKLEESRGFEKEFFLQYSNAGFEQAYIRFIKPAYNIVADVKAISSRLRSNLDKSQIYHGNNQNLNLLLMAQDRHTKTLNDTIALVKRMVEPENGLQPRQFENALLLQELLESIKDFDLLMLFMKMQSLGEQYMINGMRPVMQSSFNMAEKLKREIELKANINNTQKAQSVSWINNYLSIGQEIIEADNALRHEMAEFRLQQETMQTILNKVAADAKQQREKSREKIKWLQKFFMILIAFITILYGIFIWSAIRLLGQSITRNIEKLAQTASDFDRGNLSARLDIQTGDELGMLADIFNRMSGRLKLLIEHLEQEVLDRTKNLDAALGQLKNSENRYRSLIENQTDLVCRFTCDGSLVFVNEAYCRFFDKTRQELLGSRCQPMPVDDDLDMVEVKVSELSPSNQTLQIEKQVLSGKGEIHWIQFVNKGFFDDKGNLMEIQSVGRDITIQKRLEAEKESIQNELRQAQKMESVGRLAGGVAHDYNNALSVIMGFTELSMEELDPSGVAHANLEEVLTAAKRATQITRQLLAFARKQTIAPKVMNLNDNLREMFKMFRHLIGEDIDINWIPGVSLWDVKMDPSQIDQILVNLCVNARDAITDIGKITIETDNRTFDWEYCANHKSFIPGEFVMLAVSDNGCGMEPEILENIFEPFFTTKDIDKGTGLGLSTVYGIVKQNQGFVNVYSEIGKGTTIKIYLPRYESGIAVPEEQAGSVNIPEGRAETILMVEDDAALLNIGRRMLERLGYKVLTANSPGKAIELAEAGIEQFHLLLTDVIMPEMNGRQLSERMSSIYPDLKIVFMSGYTANVIAHHGVLDEGVHFIQKPFSQQDLAITIRKILDG